MAPGRADDVLAQLGFATHHAAALVAAPAAAVQLMLRHWRGQESLGSTWQRLGAYQARRPKGPLIWFHALTVGECAVALPVVFRCLLEYNESVHVLLTTGTPEAHALLAGSLPRRVVLQCAPFGNPASVALFLKRWRPQVGVFVESPSWPMLVETAGRCGLRMALLNARMSSRWFLDYFYLPHTRAMLGRVLSRFTLIVPQSDVDVGRFRILGATLKQMPGWCSDLKYAAALGTSVWHVWRPSAARILSLRKALAGRPVWVAASTHQGEELPIGGVHKSLRKEWPRLLTILAPRQPARAPSVAASLSSDLGLKPLLWAAGGAAAAVEGGGGGGGAALRALEEADVLVLDVAADLPLMYCVSEIAFIGNSLLEGFGGHNLAEAAVAGCAVVVGEHAGHFGQMADELNQAAVMAAEEAAAAVNSSGALFDDGYPFAQHEAAAAAAAGEAAFSGGDGGTAGGSPRDAGGHWGVLEERDSYRSDMDLGQASRPATAPAAVAYSREQRAPFSGGGGGGGEPPGPRRGGGGGAGAGSSARAAAAAAAARAGLPRAAASHSDLGLARAASGPGGGGGGGGGGAHHHHSYSQSLLGGDYGGGYSSSYHGAYGSYADGSAATSAAVSPTAAAAAAAAAFRDSVDGFDGGAIADALGGGSPRAGGGGGGGAGAGGGGAFDYHSQHYLRRRPLEDNSSDGFGPGAGGGGGAPPPPGPPPTGAGNTPAADDGGGPSPASARDGVVVPRPPAPRGLPSYLGAAVSRADTPVAALGGSEPHIFARAPPAAAPLAGGGGGGAHGEPRAAAPAQQQHQGPQQQEEQQQQQQQQQPAPRAALQQQPAAANGSLKRGGRGGEGPQTDSVDTSLSNSYANTPRLPLTPTTPHPTPYDSAPASGGRSPRAGGHASAGPPLAAAALTQALAWPAGGPANGHAAAAPAAAGQALGGCGGCAGCPSCGACAQGRVSDFGGANASEASWGDHEVPGGGASGMGGRGSYTGERPSNPVPHRGPLARGSDGGSFAGSSGCGGAGDARLGRCSSDGCFAGARRAGGAAGGSGDSESGGCGGGPPLFRCPTVGELVRLRGASDGGGGGGGCGACACCNGGAGAGGSGGGGAGCDARAPVDLFPGAAAGEGCGGAALCRQGSMGWEGWTEQQQQRQQQQQQQQRASDGADSAGTPAAAAAPAPGARPPPPPAPAPRGARARLSGGGEVDPSPLGDPGRAAHFMDEAAHWRQQQQQQQQQQQGPDARPPALSRLNIGPILPPVSAASSAAAAAAAAAPPPPGASRLSRGASADGGSAPPTQPGTASSLGWGGAGQQWRGLGLLGGADSPASASAYSPRSNFSDAQTPAWACHNRGSAAGAGAGAGGAHHAATPQSTRAAVDQQPAHQPWRAYSLGDGAGAGAGGSQRPSSGGGGGAAPAAPRRAAAGAPRLPRHDESGAGGGGGDSGTPRGGGGGGGRRGGGADSAGAGAGGYTDGRLFGPDARASSVGGTSVTGVAPLNNRGGGGGGGAAGTSYMRYAGDYILPATHLPYTPHGPAAWRVSGPEGLASAVATLLREPLERRSRGHAAAQGAAKLASGLVSTVWHVLDDMVIAPGLNDYMAAQQEAGAGGAAASNTGGARYGGRR